MNQMKLELCLPLAGPKNTNNKGGIFGVFWGVLGCFGVFWGVLGRLGLASR